MGRAKNEKMLSPEATDTTKLKEAERQWNEGRAGFWSSLASIPKALEDGKAVARKDLREIQDYNTGKSHLAASSPQYKKMSAADQRKVNKMVLKMRKERD